MKHIIELPSGYRVSLNRYGVTFRAHVPYNGDRAAALARALELRQRFYDAHGVTSPRSNTGIAGISEQTLYTHSRPRPCFAVSCGTYRRNVIKRFYYHGESERTACLHRAIAQRARLAGENPDALLAQAKAVGCV